MTNATDLTPRPEEPKAPLIDRLWFGYANPFRVIGGLVLILFVIAACFSAVVFFSAAQFQARIAELSINGTPLTIWRIEQFSKDFEKWTREVRALRANVFEVRRQVDAADRLAASLKADLVSDETAFTADLERTRLKVERLERRAAELASTKSLPVAPDSAQTEKRIHVLYAELEFRVEQLVGSTPTLKGELEEMKQQYQRLKAVRENHDSSVAGAEVNRQALNTRQTELKERVAEVARFFGGTSSDLAPDFVERVVNVSTELNALSNVWKGYVFEIARWSNDMIVLLLVISMGILGSSLQLLHIFVANDKQSLSFGIYPLHLAFGAVTAIVVFIIAKAGVPIVADTTKLGGSAPINPYFISFLAIISGLMSDRALERIRVSATNMLGTGVEKLRWARTNLVPEIKSTGRTVEALSAILEISIDDTNKILLGNQAATLAQQRIIASFIGKTVAESFVPPD